eukprot:9484552-Pyramimonas_sp.AAC.1
MVWGVVAEPMFCVQTPAFNMKRPSIKHPCVGKGRRDVPSLGVSLCGLGSLGRTRGCEPRPATTNDGDR